MSGGVEYLGEHGMCVTTGGDRGAAVRKNEGLLNYNGKPQHWTPSPSDNALDAAPASAGKPADMEIEVDGIKISLEKRSDDSWTARQGLRAQDFCRVSPQNPSNSTAATRTVTPSLPRLSPHTYHIVGRAKTPIDLMRTSPGDLQRALLKAASLCDLDPAKHDQIRIHQMNNTFTVSVTNTD
ncbi:hypothetical protein HPB51_028836 [Rhipicephalus microplus]|uniref:Uncharacterized protein n=1 Tax=Rhipicephalus microplus TaxID=6941 RepID=A0A9J6CVT9_RHIMP|nr:hypothetical protein HPB51_028836 [Rhipicephalus microplus]